MNPVQDVWRCPFQLLCQPPMALVVKLSTSYPVSFKCRQPPSARAKLFDFHSHSLKHVAILNFGLFAEESSFNRSNRSCDDSQ